MKTCPKCGREITDPRIGCTICNLQESLEGNPHRTKENRESFSDKFHNTATPQQRPSQFDANRSQQMNQNQASQNENPKQIPTPVKVIAILLIFVTHLLGAFFGIMGGMILTRSTNSDESRSFGKLLLTISTIYLIIIILGLFTFSTLFSI